MPWHQKRFAGHRRQTPRASIAAVPAQPIIGAPVPRRCLVAIVALDAANACRVAVALPVDVAVRCPSGDRPQAPQRFAGRSLSLPAKVSGRVAYDASGFAHAIVHQVSTVALSANAHPLHLASGSNGSMVCRLANAPATA